MSYATEHAEALADIRDAGAAVSFAHTSPGTYDPATDTWTTGATSTIAGYAVGVKGDPDQYRDLGLIAAQAVTLLFAPTTYGSVPDLDHSVTWGGEVYTVKDRKPLSPDGTAILSRVVVSR